MTELLSLTAEELGNHFKEQGLASYRAGQVMRWAAGYHSFSEMTDVPESLRQSLEKSYILRSAEIYKKVISKDGTVKYLLSLTDGNLVECVLMHQAYGRTLCISTQAGCRMGCAFCASGKNGLVRNLTVGELMSQVLLVNRDAEDKPLSRQITNVVLMGCGEPLDNYENVVKFLRLLTTEYLNISARNISLSTCGLADKITKFAGEGLPVTLALSLHSPFDDRRAQIMPIANKYSVKQAMSAVRYYFEKTGRRPILEYSLIQGFNTREEDAQELKRLTRGMSCHINLIALNAVDGSPLQPETAQKSKQFLNRLKELGLSATVRSSKGADIDGACGQLRNKFVGDNTPVSSDKKP